MLLTGCSPIEIEFWQKVRIDTTILVDSIPSHFTIGVDTHPHSIQFIAGASCGLGLAVVVGSPARSAVQCLVEQHSIVVHGSATASKVR